MEAIFLRRRIGALFCIVGLLTMFSAFSVFFLQPTRQTAVIDQSTHTLIIDPGHGGEDGGAVAEDGTLEAELNLAIAKKLNALAVLCGMNTVMTRTDEHIQYPADADSVSARKTADQKQRAALIGSISNGVLISIHQNWYPTAEPHGAQVLYARSSESEAFGKQMHEKLVSRLDAQNRRVAAPISDNIFLMHQAECPAVLIECGFLSNPEELSRLKDSSYQTKLSILMLSTYWETFETGWSQ